MMLKHLVLSYRIYLGSGEPVGALVRRKLMKNLGEKFLEAFERRAGD
jgi:hypothetical protein